MGGTCIYYHPEDELCTADSTARCKDPLASGTRAWNVLINVPSETMTEIPAVGVPKRDSEKALAATHRQSSRSRSPKGRRVKTEQSIGKSATAVEVRSAIGGA